jgi:hypothetical protein
VPQTGCSGAPNIASFSANPSTISASGSSTLSWGAVTNADSVSIDPDVGGVATPGSVTVSPGGTTTYTLTAHCGSNSLTRQATVTVQAAQPPPPPQDKQGPAISGPGWSAKSLYYNGTGCGPSSFDVNATVTDPSGVKFAQVTYRYLPDGGKASNPNGISMNPSGGDNYSATIDVSKDAYAALGGGNGQVEFWVVAQDGVGNNSQSSTKTVTIQDCPP